jgi:hypothetical protein
VNELERKWKEAAVSLCKVKNPAFLERLRKTMKTFKRVGVPAGIRIWYLPKSVQRLNAHFVVHNTIITI